jgi:cardiolipin synthase
MKVKKRARYVIFFLFLAILLSVIEFAFNPLGLGPEPDQVLTPDFFASPLQDSNDLELLVDGQEAFDAILRVIDSANTAIHVQTYIWKDDAIGGQVAASLKKAADRGVQVTISKDVLGTVFEVFDMLAGRPSPVYTRSGLRGYDNITVRTDIFEENDHSKYFVVDGQTTIFGGMNIADEYHTEWHDYMVWIRHQRFTQAFEARVLRGEPWPVKAPVVLAVNDPEATEIRTALIEMLDHAKEKIIIEHAYFSDDQVIDAVGRAARRGVEVDLILPKEPDTHIYANRATINQLLEMGAETSLRVFLYPRMTHAKVMLVDWVIAAVGSANLTPRSMLTSKEITLFLSGTETVSFIRELGERLATDIAESQRIETPYALSWIEKVQAVVGKYVW